MINVKTFTNELKALHTLKALDDLDAGTDSQVRVGPSGSIWAA